MIEVKLTFRDEQELLAFFTRTAGTYATNEPKLAESPAESPKLTKAKPAPEAPPKPAPERVKEPAPTADPSPAPVATSAPAAPAEPPPAPAPAPQAVAPAQAAPVKYEDSGIPSMVPAYLGKPGTDGYDARRAALVALLGKYGVTSAKTLTPEQFEPFKADLAAL